MKKLKFWLCPKLSSHQWRFLFRIGFIIHLPFHASRLGNGIIPTVAGIMGLIMRAFGALILADSFGFAGACCANPLAWIGACIPLAIAYYATIRKLAPVTESEEYKHKSPLSISENETKQPKNPLRNHQRGFLLFLNCNNTKCIQNGRNQNNNQTHRCNILNHNHKKLFSLEEEFIFTLSIIVLGFTTNPTKMQVKNATIGISILLLIKSKKSRKLIPKG